MSEGADVMFQEIIKKAKEWEKEICICSQCYTDKVALVFPPFGQKIMFLSESPFNFPDESKTLEDFIEKDFYGSICDRAKTEIITSRPSNIFDFMHKTFRPVFSDTPKRQDAEKFFRCVYWTHIAKKSLRCLSGNRIEYAEKCSEATIREELRKIHPRLMIVASSIALWILFNIRYTEAFGKQVEKISKSGMLLTVKELICEERNPLLSGISDIKDCEVAVFPNPSPRNNFWKKKAYGKEEMKKVLESIRLALQNMC